MLRAALRFVFPSLVFGMAFVVNPAYLTGCSGSDDDEADFEQIEADLLARLDDVNEQAAVTFTYNGENYELLLALSQQSGDDKIARVGQTGLMTAAHACGTRTFFQSASACDTSYELAVEGTFTLRRLGGVDAEDEAETVAQDVAVSGRLSDYSEVWLSFGKDNHLTLHPNQDSYELTQFKAENLGEEQLDIHFPVWE